LSEQNPAVTCIGVLAHPLRPQTFPLAERIIEGLKRYPVRTWMYTEWQGNEVIEDVRCADLVIAIGGDGAMLRAARACAPYGIPVLGINMGQLGFLTEISQPDAWEPYVEAVLRGEFWIETRMMLRVDVKRGETTVVSGEALNDIVISGSVIGRMIQLDTYIDSDWATTYNADALVVSTATGSTAYALALGGPILPPELGNILIVPAAPHLSMDRPIVLAEGAQVEVRAAATNRNDIVISADGAVLHSLGEDERICIQGSEFSSRFARLRSRNYFYRSLLDRLEPRVSRPGTAPPPNGLSNTTISDNHHQHS
jgi:NAD+ kinase